MAKAKGGHALKRDEFSPDWVHKDPLPPDIPDHPADPHYTGEVVWHCYDCDRKVVIAESRMTFAPKARKV